MILLSLLLAASPAPPADPYVAACQKGIEIPGHVDQATRDEYVQQCAERLRRLTQQNQPDDNSVQFDPDTSL